MYTGIMVTDLGSTNGTYIDGKQIESGVTTQVKPSQTVVFGTSVDCTGSSVVIEKIRVYLYAFPVWLTWVNWSVKGGVYETGVELHCTIENCCTRPAFKNVHQHSYQLLILIYIYIWNPWHYNDILFLYETMYTCRRWASCSIQSWSWRIHGWDVSFRSKPSRLWVRFSRSRATENQANGYGVEKKRKEEGGKQSTCRLNYS